VRRYLSFTDKDGTAHTGTASKWLWEFSPPKATNVTPAVGRILNTGDASVQVPGGAVTGPTLFAVMIAPEPSADSTSATAVRPTSRGEAVGTRQADVPDPIARDSQAVDAAPETTIATGHTYQLSASSSDGTPVTTFDAPVTITVAYTDSDVVHADTTTLGLYQWDDTHSSWVALATTVDMPAHQAVATTTTPGIYSLRARPLNPAPVISDVSPAAVFATAETAITVTGINFLPTPQLNLGIGALDAHYVSSSTLTATIPPMDPGAYTLTLRNPDGQVATLSNALSLVDPQTATAVARSNPTMTPSLTATPSATPINTPIPPTATPTNTSVPPAAPTSTPNPPVVAPTSMPNPPVVVPTNTAVPPSAPPTTAPTSRVTIHTPAPTSTVAHNATVIQPTATRTPISRVAGVARTRLVCARPAVARILVDGQALTKGTQLLSGQMVAVAVRAAPRMRVQTLIDLTHTVTTTTGTGRHRKTVKRTVVVGHIAATATTNRTGDATGYARIAYVPATTAMITLKVGAHAACGGSVTLASSAMRLKPAYVTPMVSVSLPNGKAVSGATIKTNSAIVVRVNAAEHTPVKIAVTLHVQGSKESVTYTAPSNARQAAPYTGKLDGYLMEQVRIPYEPRQYRVAATLTVSVSAWSTVGKTQRTLTATTGALHVTLQSERPPQRVRHH